VAKQSLHKNKTVHVTCDMWLVPPNNDIVIN